MTLLKQQIETGAYRVDARAVAGEMIAKLRLLSRTRRALLGGAPASDDTQRPERS